MCQCQKYDSPLNKPNHQRGGRAVWHGRAMARPEAALKYDTAPNDNTQADALMWRLKVVMAAASQGEQIRKKQRRVKEACCLSALQASCCAAELPLRLLSHIWGPCMAGPPTASQTPLMRGSFFLPTSHLDGKDVVGRVAGGKGGSSCCSVLRAR